MGKINLRDLLMYKNLKTERKVGHQIARNYIFLIEAVIGIASGLLYVSFPRSEPMRYFLLLGVIVGGLGFGAFISNTKEYLAHLKEKK